MNLIVLIIAAIMPIATGWMLGELLWKVHKRIRQWNAESFERWRQGNE